MNTPSWLFGLLDLLLVFAAVGGFAWWQLHDLAREKRAAQVRRQAADAAAAGLATAPGVTSASVSASGASDKDR